MIRKPLFQSSQNKAEDGPGEQLEEGDELDEGDQPKNGHDEEGRMLVGANDGDQPKDGIVDVDGGLKEAYNEEGDELHKGDQPKDGHDEEVKGLVGANDGDQSKDGLVDVDGALNDRPCLNSTGGSSWLGTQEDRVDFVILSDEYLGNTKTTLGKGRKTTWLNLRMVWY